MNEKEIAEAIYEKWESQMTTDKRKHQLLDQNFDLIVQDLFMSGITFKLARDTFKQAISYMKPSTETINHMYGKSKFKKFRSKQEFAVEWIKSVENIGNRVFYNYYDIETHPGKPGDVKVPASAKPNKVRVQPSGAKTDDELNAEDFHKSIKSVSEKSPWLFADEEDSNE